MSDVTIRKGYIPGAIGRVADIHGRYYHENWNFGAFFEAKVARELADFIIRYSMERDGFWTALLDGKIEGAITIDSDGAAEKGAHLRWFIVSDAIRGQGVGTRLINQAVSFCRNAGYPRVYLWTFEGLNPARHLYEKTGFKLAEEQEGSGWGTKVIEQRFELLLK